MDSIHPFPVIEVHVHVHPQAAETFLQIMDLNNLQRVVNLGALERLGFPFGTHERQIEYPGYPIQGRWKVDAIGLPEEVLEKLYFRNAQRLIPGLR